MKNLNFLRFASRITLLLAVVVSFGLSANAQVTVPDGFQYQAIARDASGVPMANTPMSVKFIVDADNAMPVEQVFTTVQTNDFGLFNLVVGGIDFEGLVNPTVEVLIDLDGLGYNSLGVVPFQSVPYAEVAGNVAYVEAGQLHVGNDVFNVGNFFTGTPGIVEPLEAVVVDAAKGVAGFGNVGIEGALNVDGSVTTGQQSIVFINNQDQNNGDAISGALRVAGGVGIAKDVYVGGSIVAAGDISNNGNLSTTDITADDIVATTISVLDANVASDIMVGGDATVNGDLMVGGDLEVTDITAGDITADNVTADDFYGNFHGGTLDLGAAKSVTVGDILTAVADDDAALVTAGAVFDADAALEEDLTALIDANGALISANQQGIIANTLAIQSNYALIVTNSDAIQQNRDDIADNLELIGENAEDIASNASDIDNHWAFVQDELDLQHAYDNGNEILTDGNPVDVTAETGISVQGTNGDFVGQLAGDNAAVYGTDGTNWAALAYAGVAKDGPYAGYFHGNVHITNDIVVENAARVQSESTADFSGNGALVVEGGVGIKDNLTVSNSIETHGEVIVGTDLTVHMDTYLEHDATVGTDENDMLTVNATTVFNAPVTMEEELTVNNNATVNGMLTASDAHITGDLTVGGTTDVQEFTLDGDYGDEDELMISQGANENPIWTSVADLMANLTDGAGIQELDFDGSVADVVEADVDMATVIFNGVDDGQIAVNEGYAFNWTNDHSFAENVTIEGILGTSMIENVMGDLVTINDDLAVAGALDVTGDAAFGGDVDVDGGLDVVGDVTASSVTTNAVETGDLTVNEQIMFDAATISALTLSSENVYPLAGDDNIPTSGAVTGAVNTAITDALDVLYFQKLYDNATASGDDANYEIIADEAPMQIKSTGVNGALDVYVYDAAAAAIDARMTDGAEDAYVVRGMFDGGYQGALASRYDGATAGVLGSDGNPTGVWGALAYDAGAKFGGPYAGYFNGNTYTTEDQRVMGSVTIGTADGGGVLQVLDDTPVDATNGQGGSGFFNGGLGVNENLYVRKAIIGRQSIEIGAESSNYFYSDINGTSIGNSTDLGATLDVWNTTTFENEVTLNDELNLPAAKGVAPGNVKDLMISQGAGTNPVWTSVADLMENLTDGAGIQELDFDGSVADVVEADVDMATVIFNGVGDGQIAVNEGHAFNWTNNHTFALDVTVGGILGTSTIENLDGDIVTVDDDLDVNGGLTVSDAVVFEDALTVGGAFHAQGAATMSSTLDVTGNTTVGGTMGIAGNTTVGGTFHAQGVVTMSDALTVDGDVEMNNALTVASDVILGSSCTNTLVVNAMADFNCDVTALALTVETTLHVNGVVTMSDALTVDGDVTMGHDLSVASDVEIAGNLEALGADITLGTSSAVTLLTVNASSVFNGPVDINGILEIDGLILDDQLLTTVRTDNSGDQIRPYTSAEDTELITEKAIASWLPDTKGYAQEGRALVLNSAGVITPDGTAGSAFDMDMGTGTLNAGTLGISTINASGTTTTQTLQVDGFSTFGTGATFSAGTVTFSGTAAVNFNQNPDLAAGDYLGTALSSVDVTAVQIIRIDANGTMPSVVTDRLITIINTSASDITVSGSIAGGASVVIEANSATQFVSDASYWYPVQ